MKSTLWKIAKWFLGIVLGVALLITAAVYFFKDEICGVVITEVNKHLKAQVSVRDVDLTFWGSFPNLSVDFNEVFIRDSYKGATVRDTLLYTERIRLKFNPIDIWNEEYTVRSIDVRPGTLQLKVDDRGEVNYDIVKPSEDTASTSFELNLKEVVLEGIRFSYDNKATAQLYTTHVEDMKLSGAFSQSRFTLDASSKLLVKKARSGNVTLLSNKQANFDLKINVDKETDVFEIPRALVYVQNLPFRLKGKVTRDDLDFEIHADQVELSDLANSFAVSQVEDIKKFDGSGKVYFDVQIHGETKTTSTTEIECDFGVENGSLREPMKNLRINNIHVDGKYSNKGGRSREFLHLKEIRFSTPGGPFNGNLMITTFESPNLRGKANGILSLKMVHALFSLPHVDQINGDLGVGADFNIQAVPQENGLLDYAVLKCEGEIDMRGVNLKLIEDKRTFADMNGSMYLRNDEAGVEDVRVKIGSTDLQFNGVFRNIMDYFEKKGHLDADVEVKSEHIDVADLGTTTKEEKIMDGRQFVLPDNIDGSVYLEVGKLDYEKHAFRLLKGNMLVGGRKIHFPAISLRNAEADITGSLMIEERTPEIFFISTRVTTDNLQFKPLFREWDNFRQDVIGENNIYGKAHADVYFEAPFDLRSGIISGAIRSEVYLRITDGRLKGVDAFRSITESLRTSSSARIAIGKENIASLEKKLLDLRFETLENTFVIRNSRLEIPEMTIHTSALDIDVSGTHTFSNRIDYRFAFRFRDLKEKDQISEFGEEVDDGTGMRVYMRMYGDIDDPTIEWDKDAKKEDNKAYREQEKQNLKSMLKSEFGAFKGDSTVKTYVPKEAPKEELRIEFGNETKEEQLEPRKPKKDTKIKSTLKGWKEEQQRSGQEEVELN